MWNGIEDFLSDWMLWIKSIHIIAVIAWMAGLFYLPRLFVYHVEQKNESLHQTFCIMERKLYCVIMQPAMHLSLLFGFILSMIQDTWLMPWFHIKMLAVIFLIAYHFFLNHCRISLWKNSCTYTGRFFRILNEVPTFLLIVIVFMVVLKPF